MWEEVAGRRIGIYGLLAMTSVREGLYVDNV